MKDQDARDLAKDALDTAVASENAYGQMRQAVNQQSTAMKDIGAALVNLQDRINSTRLGYIKDCPKCGHPAPMQEITFKSAAPSGNFSKTVAGYQCLVCGQMYREQDTPAAKELIPYNLA